MKLEKRIATLALLSAFGLIGYARLAEAHFTGGGQNGNGGDICEDRIKTIRDDIESWIHRSGSQGLVLPKGVVLGRYNSAMQIGISKAQIICTSDKVVVNGAEKTCKNFADVHGTAKIICNQARFMGTNDSDQYVLVHHEFAGLAGFEENKGVSSDYSISNQLTGYLSKQTVVKLAVHPQRSGGNPDNVGGSQGIPVYEESKSLIESAQKRFEHCTENVQTNGAAFDCIDHEVTVLDWAIEEKIKSLLNDAKTNPDLDRSGQFSSNLKQTVGQFTALKESVCQASRQAYGGGNNSYFDQQECDWNLDLKLFAVLGNIEQAATYKQAD